MIVVLKVGEVEEFSTADENVRTEPIDVKKPSSNQNNQNDKSGLFIPLIFLPMFFYTSRSYTELSSNKEAFDSSKKTVSNLITAHTHICSDILMRTFINKMRSLIS